MAQITMQQLLDKIQNQAVAIARLEIFNAALEGENAQLREQLAAAGDPVPVPPAPEGD